VRVGLRDSPSLVVGKVRLKLSVQNNAGLTTEVEGTGKS
jgi:hypothetical protein